MIRKSALALLTLILIAPYKSLKLSSLVLNLNSTIMKFLFRTVFLTVTSLLLFSNCKKDPLTSAESGPLAQPKTTVSSDYFFQLRDSLDFPHSVSNMQAALDFLDSRGLTHLSNGIEVSATHMYVRFSPEDSTDLSILSSMESEYSYYDLHTSPMHYEYQIEGSYRPFVVTSDTASDYQKTSLYAMLPIDAALPSGVKRQIIDSLYQSPDTEAGLLVVSTILAGYQHKIDYQFQNTEMDREALESFLEPYNNPNGHSSFLQSFFFRPKGYFEVWDTAENDFMPVKYCHVKLSGFLNPFWNNVHTDHIGYFEHPNNVLGTITVRVGWKSHTCTPRYRLLDWFNIGLSDFLMKLKRTDNNKTEQVQTNDPMKWAKATVHLAVQKYNFFAQINNIDHLHNANIWIGKIGENSPIKGACLMGRHYGFILGINTVWNFFFPLTAISLPLNLVVHFIVPDIYISYNSFDTDKIEQLCFHEFGHYSHADHTSHGYWADVIDRQFNNINSLSGDPYGNGTQPTVWSGNLIALVEGWATLMEGMVMKYYYNGQWYGPSSTMTNVDSDFEKLNYQRVPSNINTPSTRSWFLHQLMWDLLDDSQDYLNPSQGTGVIEPIPWYLPIHTVEDNVCISNGTYLSPEPIFELLTSGTENAQDLKAELLSQYPGLANEIDDLYNFYYN